MNAIFSFVSKQRTYFISFILTIVVCLTAYFVVHWEIQQTKARAFEKAKEVVTAPEKIDKASKIAGRVMDIRNMDSRFFCFYSL